MLKNNSDMTDVDHYKYTSEDIISLPNSSKTAFQ